jgi:hypothetical protein
MSIMDKVSSYLRKDLFTKVNKYKFKKILYIIYYILYRYYNYIKYKNIKILLKIILGEFNQGRYHG